MSTSVGMSACKARTCEATTGAVYVWDGRGHMSGTLGLCMCAQETVRSSNRLHCSTHLQGLIGGTPASTWHYCGNCLAIRARYCHTCKPMAFVPCSWLCL